MVRFKNTHYDGGLFDSPASRASRSLGTRKQPVENKYLSGSSSLFRNGFQTSRHSAPFLCEDLILHVASFIGSFSTLKDFLFAVGISDQFYMFIVKHPALWKNIKWEPLDFQRDVIFQSVLLNHLDCFKMIFQHSIVRHENDLYNIFEGGPAFVKTIIDSYVEYLMAPQLLGTQNDVPHTWSSLLSILLSYQNPNRHNDLLSSSSSSLLSINSSVSVRQQLTSFGDYPYHQYLEDVVTFVLSQDSHSAQFRRNFLDLHYIFERLIFKCLISQSPETFRFVFLLYSRISQPLRVPVYGMSLENFDFILDQLRACAHHHRLSKSIVQVILDLLDMGQEEGVLDTRQKSSTVVIVRRLLDFCDIDASVYLCKWVAMKQFF